jgi:hypothetical protein
MNYENQFSTILESLDIPRVPARVVTALLGAEPGSHSAASIMETTSLSKAAISGGLQYLDALGVLEYVHTSSGRRRLLRLRPTKLANYTKRRMVGFHSLAGQLGQFAADVSDAEYKAEIVDLACLFETLDEVVNNTIAQWEGSHEEQR